MQGCDDTTPNVWVKSLECVFKILQEHSSMAMNWFENIYIKVDSDKRNLLS